jgi:hypothetical protein
MAFQTKVGGQSPRSYRVTALRYRVRDPEASTPSLSHLGVLGTDYTKSIDPSHHV